MSSSLPDIEPPDDPAADWAARLDAGQLSAGETLAFAEYLEQDPKNRARVQSYRQVHLDLKGAVLRLMDEGSLVEQSDDSIHPVVRPPRAVFRRWAVGMAAAAALVFAGIWWHARPQVITTNSAMRQSVALSDGTRLDLNARTVLSVQLRGETRRVVLTEGEAYFEVAKDASRAFLVETPGGTVRVTGTHFNVRVDQPGELQVTVLEGSVTVNSIGGTDEAFPLKPDDQLTVAGVEKAVRHLAPSFAEGAIAWREGRVLFEREPLGSAIRRLSRYSGRQIEVDPKVSELELGGRFQLDEPDQFLSDIALTLPVKVLRLPDGTTRIVPR